MYYIRDMKTLAARLIWARERKALTQDVLANLSGVSQSTIGNLESGIRKSARRIVNIAAALDVDPLWLSDGKGTATGAPTNVQPFIALAPPPVAQEPKRTLAHDDELSLLDLYRRADARGKRAIVDIAEQEGRAAADEDEV